MTAREKYIVDFILKFEGGYAGNIDGQICTMKGVTLNTYRSFYGKNKTCDDLRKITDEEWFEIFRKGFYDKIKGDSIKNDSICLIVVDFAYNSGVKTAIKNVQKALNCTADGIIGPKTLAALNSEDAEGVFESIYAQRYWYYWNIAQKPSKAKFLKGWLRRLNSIDFKAAVS